MSCLFCHSETKLYFNYGRYVNLPYALTRCVKCGLVQTDPMPTEEFLCEWYQKYDVLGEREPYYKSMQAKDPWSTREGMEIALRFVLVKRALTGYRLPVTGYRLLEIGSGHGLFLDLVKRAGWEGIGIELNSRAVAVSRERYAISVHEGTIESIELASESFDVITLWDIFEHVRDPLQLIKRAHQLLKSGGLLFLETPNSSALLDVVVVALAKLGYSGPAVTFYGPHHLTLWNSKNLRRLLEENGFAVQSIRNESTPASRVFRGTTLCDRLMRFGIGAVQGLGKLFGRENKMIIIAQKPISNSRE